MQVIGSNYKEVILHAGIHKTGTSYLQKIFSQNRALLGSRSIHYPAYRRENQHGGNHSSAIFHSADAVNAAKALNRILALESGCDRLLLSAEELSREEFSPKVLSDLRRSFPFSHFRVVIYLRRFDHLIESVYAESVKDTLVGDIEDAQYQLDFRKTLAPFETILGNDCVVVRPYRKAQWPNGSLLDDFLASIGEGGVAGSFPLQPEVNVSLSRQETHLLSITPPGPWKHAAREVIRRGGYRSDDDSRYFRSPADRKIFVDAHRHMLRDIAERHGLGNVDEFFGLDDFDDDPMWRPFVADSDVIAAFLRDLEQETTRATAIV